MDVAEFLAARLDEDERSALAASSEYNRQATEPEHWRWECATDDEPLDPGLAIAGNAEFLDHGQHYRIGLRSLESYPTSVGPLVHLVLSDEEVSPQVARHIARHDPARVLREVEAKRYRLERYLEYPGYDLPGGVQEGRDPDERESDQAVKDALEGEVLADAFIYSGHPDYDPAWGLPSRVQS